MGRSLSLAAYRALSLRKQNTVDEAPQPPRPKGEVIWAHAADPERAMALLDLAKRLDAQRPGAALLLSCGAEIEPDDPLQAAARESGAICTALTPDHPGAARRFMAHWRPDLCLWTGGQLWINHVSAAADSGIPLILADIEQIDLETRRHKWFPDLTRTVLDFFNAILANSTAAAREVRRLGVDRVKVSVAPRMRASPMPPACSLDELSELTDDLASRPVWLAVAARSDEIAPILAAHRSALRLAHRLLLVLSPAEPLDREALETNLRAAGLRFEDWDECGVIEDHTQVLLSADADDLGLWYRIAPLAFLASSLEPGATGVDPLDAAALGSAILYGPNVGRHIDTYARLAAAGAARTVSNSDSLSAALVQLMAPDHAAAMALAGWEVATEGAETTDRLLDLIQDGLDRNGGNHAAT